MANTAHNIVITPYNISTPTLSGSPYIVTAYTLPTLNYLNVTRVDMSSVVLTYDGSFDHVSINRIQSTPIVSYNINLNNISLSNGATDFVAFFGVTENTIVPANLMIIGRTYYFCTSAAGSNQSIYSVLVNNSPISNTVTPNYCGMSVGVYDSSLNPTFYTNFTNITVNGINYIRWPYTFTIQNMQILNFFLYSQTGVYPFAPTTTYAQITIQTTTNILVNKNVTTNQFVDNDAGLGLIPDQSYVYVVTSRNAIDVSNTYFTTPIIYTLPTLFNAQYGTITKSSILINFSGLFAFTNISTNGNTDPYAVAPASSTYYGMRLTTNTASYTGTNLQPNTAYYYVLVPYNIATPSVSGQFYYMPTVYTYAQFYTYSYSNITYDSIQINLSGAYNYVTISRNSGAVVVLPPGTNVYVDTGLTYDTKYYYIITTYNNSNILGDITTTAPVYTAGVVTSAVSSNTTINSTLLTITGIYNYLQVARSDGFVITLSGNSYNTFSPLSVMNLVCWLDANDPYGNGTAMSNGAQVSTWYDKSGLSNNLTQTNGSYMPTYSTNIRNGLNAIYLNGSQFMLNTTVPFPAGNYSVFAVCDLTSNNGSWSRLINGTVNDAQLLFGTNNGYDVDGLGNGSGWIDLGNTTIGGTSQYVYNSWYLKEIINSGTSTGWQPYINGTTCDPRNATSTIAFTGFELGGHASGANQPWIGYVAEILIFNRALNTTERQNVEGYLAGKWGLQGNLPNTHPYYNVANTSNNNSGLGTTYIDTNLLTDYTYTYTLLPYNSMTPSLSGAYYYTDPVYTLPQLNTFQVDNYDCSSVTLNFDGCYNFVNIYRNSSLITTVSGGVASSNRYYTDFGVVSNASYNYTITPYNLNSPPDVGLNRTASVMTRGNLYSYSYSITQLNTITLNVSGIYSYVTVARGNNAPVALGVGVSTFTDTNLLNDASYSYTVVPYNFDTPPAPGLPYFTSPIFTLPNLTSYFVGNVTTSSIRLVFDGCYNTVTITDNGNVIASNVNIKTFLDNSGGYGLLPDTIHNFIITPYNPDNVTGPVSDNISVYTLPTITYMNYIPFAYSSIIFFEGSFNYVELYRNNTLLDYNTSTTTISPYFDNSNNTALIPNTPYTYTVIPYNHQSVSGQYITTSLYTNPTISTVVFGNITTNSIQLVMTGGFDYVNITRNILLDSVVTTIGNVRTFAYIDNSSSMGLLSSTAYSYTVTPYSTNSGLLVGPTTNTITTYTLPRLTSVSTSSITYRSIQLNFNGYYQYVSITNGNVIINPYCTASYFVDDNSGQGLLPDTSYSYVVTPYNGNSVAGAASNVITVSTAANINYIMVDNSNATVNSVPIYFDGSFNFALVQRNGVVIGNVRQGTNYTATPIYTLVYTPIYRPIYTPVYKTIYKPIFGNVITPIYSPVYTPIYGNAIIGNVVVGNVVIGNTITGNIIVGNTITANVIVGNTITGYVITGNAITGNVIVGNTFVGNLVTGNIITYGRYKFTSSNLLPNAQYNYTITPFNRFSLSGTPTNTLYGYTRPYINSAYTSDITPFSVNIQYPDSSCSFVSIYNNGYNIANNIQTTLYTDNSGGQGLLADTCCNYVIIPYNAIGVSGSTYTLPPVYTLSIIYVAYSTTLQSVIFSLSGAYNYYDVYRDGVLINVDYINTFTDNSGGMLMPNTGYFYQIVPFDINNLAGVTYSQTIYTLPLLTTFTIIDVSTNLVQFAFDGSYNYINISNQTNGTLMTNISNSNAFIDNSGGSGLLSNTLYTYVATPYNASNIAGNSITVTGYTLPILTALSYTSNTSDSITLHYDGSFATVEIDNNSNVIATGITNKTFVDNSGGQGLTPDTAYIYTVIPYNVPTVSYNFLTVTGYTLPLLTYYAFVTTTYNSVQLQIDGIFSTINITRNGIAVTPSIVGNIYTDSTVRPNVSYSYIITPYNSVNQVGVASNQIDVITAPQISNVIYTATPTSITLSISGNYHHYDVAQNGTTIATSIYNATFTDNNNGMNLVSNSAYAYTILPYSNNNVQGTAYNVNVITQPALYDVTYSSTASSVQLLFAGLYNYVNIYQNQTTIATRVHDVSYNIGNLTTDASYSYTVVPYNINDVSSTSFNVVIETLPTLYAVSYVADTSAVRLSVTGTYSYINIHRDGNTIYDHLFDNSYNDNNYGFGLVPNTTYSYSVIPYNLLGANGTSINVSIQTRPLLYSVTVIPGSTTIQLSISGAYSYVDIFGNNVSLVYSLYDTSYTFVGANDNTLYTFEIIPYNSNDISGSPITVSGEELPVLYNLAFSSIGSSSVNLSISGSYSYVNIVRDNSSVINHLTDISFTDTGLSPNAIHNYTVIPYNAINVLNTSQQISVTTLPVIYTTTYVSDLSSITMNISGIYDYVQIKRSIRDVINYTFVINYQGSDVFNGIISVDYVNSIVTAFYDATNPSVDILDTAGYDGSDRNFDTVNNILSFGGTVVNSLPFFNNLSSGSYFNIWNPGSGHYFIDVLDTNGNLIPGQQFACDNFLITPYTTATTFSSQTTVVSMLQSNTYTDSTLGVNSCINTVFKYTIIPYNIDDISGTPLIINCSTSPLIYNVYYQDTSGSYYDASNVTLSIQGNYNYVNISRNEIPIVSNLYDVSYTDNSGGFGLIPDVCYNYMITPYNVYGGAGPTYGPVTVVTLPNINLVTFTPYDTTIILYISGEYSYLDIAQDGINLVTNLYDVSYTDVSGSTGTGLLINQYYTYVITAYNSDNVPSPNPYTIVTETIPAITSLGYIIDGSNIVISVTGGFSRANIAINNVLVQYI